jgi:hypothetical protein
MRLLHVYTLFAWFALFDVVAKPGACISDKSKGEEDIYQIKINNKQVSDRL